MNSETSTGDTFRVDLTNCDREPIHIPNLVQAHGVLVALDENLNILQISENSAEHFGRPAGELLGQSLGKLAGEEYLAYLEAEILPQAYEDAPLYLSEARINGKAFEALAHRCEGVLILEFERASADALKTGQNIYGVLRTKLSAINSARTVAEFCQKAAETVRSFTGFDRVMIYEFLEDDSGKVIAEAKSEDMEPFFGLHYPASDIPKQARALYLKQTLRFKVDIDDTPSPLWPALNPKTQRPLDMSYAATRAMSPIHVEYLKNIGVAASMSISIVKDGRLWGLIACHHSSPRYIPHQARMVCEFVAHTISLEIESKTNTENFEYISRLKDAGSAIIEELAECEEISRCLISGENHLLTTLRSGGAALVFDDKIHLVGTTPTEHQTKKLVEWLWKENRDEIFATNRLSKFLPSAEEYAAEASGILAVRLTKGAPEYLMWFRAEHAHTVEWAGNPENRSRWAGSASA